jgi:hypothetical protein
MIIEYRPIVIFSALTCDVYYYYYFIYLNLLYILMFACNLPRLFACSLMKKIINYPIKAIIINKSHSILTVVGRVDDFSLYRNYNFIGRTKTLTLDDHFESQC